MYSQARTNQTLFESRGTNSLAKIKRMTNADEIDPKVSCDILVNSFIGEYRGYLQPHDISPELVSWREGENSVQAYYERYFAAEYEKFKQQKIPFWVCAYIGDKLVGWATFEFEKNNAVYMDLLIVDPAEQGKGVGTQLVKSLITLTIIPDLTAVHLLLRTKNKGARNFYVEKLGFYDDENFTRSDNFVDRTLLTPLTWKNPAVIAEQVNLSDLSPRKKL